MKIDQPDEAADVMDAKTPLLPSPEPELARLLKRQESEVASPVSHSRRQSSACPADCSVDTPDAEDPYAQRARFIGPEHGLPGVKGLLRLTPPGWQVGQPPLDPEQVQRAYQRECNRLQEANRSGIESAKHLTGTRLEAYHNNRRRRMEEITHELWTIREERFKIRTDWERIHQRVHLPAPMDTRRTNIAPEYVSSGLGFGGSGFLGTGLGNDMQLGTQISNMYPATHTSIPYQNGNFNAGVSPYDGPMQRLRNSDPYRISSHNDIRGNPYSTSDAGPYYMNRMGQSAPTKHLGVTNLLGYQVRPQVSHEDSEDRDVPKAQVVPTVQSSLNEFDTVGDRQSPARSTKYKGKSTISKKSTKTNRNRRGPWTDMAKPDPKDVCPRTKVPFKQCFLTREEYKDLVKTTRAIKTEKQKLPLADYRCYHKIPDHEEVPVELRGMVMYIPANILGDNKELVGWTDKPDVSDALKVQYLHACLTVQVENVWEKHGIRHGNIGKVRGPKGRTTQIPEGLEEQIGFSIDDMSDEDSDEQLEDDTPPDQLDIPGPDAPTPERAIWWHTNIGGIPQEIEKKMLANADQMHRNIDAGLDLNSGIEKTAAERTRPRIEYKRTIAVDKKKRPSRKVIPSAEEGMRVPDSIAYDTMREIYGSSVEAQSGLAPDDPMEGPSTQYPRSRSRARRGSSKRGPTESTSPLPVKKRKRTTPAKRVPLPPQCSPASNGTAIEGSSVPQGSNPAAMINNSKRRATRRSSARRISYREPESEDIVQPDSDDEADAPGEPDPDYHPAEAKERAADDAVSSEGQSSSNKRKKTGKGQRVLEDSYDDYN